MFGKYFLIQLIIIDMIAFKGLLTEFVTVGNYTDYQRFGINQPTCGLRRVPAEYENKCFKNIKKIDLNTDNRIFNGIDARDGESPWTVYLQINHYLDEKAFIFGPFKKKEYKCTGVLIAFNWLLSAAHCFEQWFWKNTTHAWSSIHAGSSHKQGIQERWAYKNQVFIHPDYNPSVAGDPRDVALVKLTKPFTQVYTTDREYHLNAVCLPERDQINTDDEMAYSFGYGLVSLINGVKHYSDYLQKSHIYLSPFSLCDKFFCAYVSDDESRICKGDSGSPLVQYIDNGDKTVLIGIAQGDETVLNNTIECGPIESKLFWSPVPHFIDFIFNTIKQNN